MLTIFLSAGLIGCSDQEEQVQPVTEAAAPTPIVESMAQQKNLPDWQYVGYKIVHHMTLQMKHIEKFGFNTFDHPPIANYQSFVITPALDHIYSKAVADLRNGPVVVNTPARDDRYSSLEVFDMEHHAIYAEVTGPEAQQYVIAHVDYDGELPEGLHAVSPSDVSIVYLEPFDSGVKARRINIDDDGEFQGKWPRGFFGERREELL